MIRAMLEAKKAARGYSNVEEYKNDNTIHAFERLRMDSTSQKSHPWSRSIHQCHMNELLFVGYNIQLFT